MSRLVLILSVLGFSLFLASCSPGAKPAATNGASPANATGQRPTTPAGIAAYQGADRQQLLEDGAKEEGHLVWYTALIAGIQDALVKGFEAKYPYVKVDVYRADTPTLLTRVQSELQAKKPSFDVMGADWGATLTLQNLKALAPYASPNAKDYPASVRSSAQGGLDYGVMDERDCFGFAYNTNALPESAVPKTYKDLLNPALKSKMTVTLTTTGVQWTGNIITNQGDAFAQQLAKQDIKVQQVSAKALVDLMASGEVVASPAVYRPHVLQAIAAGAPVKWVGLEPVTCANDLTFISATAPHPHAAMLWTDYILGPEGQKVMRDNDYQSPVKDPDFKVWDPEKGLTLDQDEQKYNQWQQFLQTQIAGH